MAYTTMIARHVQGALFQSFVVAVVALLGVSQIHAQTLSIVNMDSSREAILLEASLKRFLRADGYTVLGSGTEGYVVLLHGMSATTNQEFIEKFTTVMGSPVIYLAGTTAIDGNAETVAEILASISGLSFDVRLPTLTSPSGRWITAHSSTLVSVKPVEANMGYDEIKGRSAKTDDNDPVH